MKTKKASTSVVGALILVVLTVVLVIGIFFYVLEPTAKDQSNIEAVKSWVWASSAKKTVTLGSAPSTRPPVSYLSEPYSVESEKQLKEELNPVLADSVYDCANAFNFGETNFMSNLNTHAFCFQCRAIKVSDDLKSKGYTLIGLKEYLETTKPISGSGTYMEIMREKAIKNNFVVMTEQIQDGSIPVNHDLYIYFVALDKKLTISEGAKIGAAGAAAYGFLVGGPGTAVMGAGAGALGGAIAVAVKNMIYDSDNFRTFVFVTSSTMINQVCNSETVKSQSTKQGTSLTTA